MLLRIKLSVIILSCASLLLCFPTHAADSSALRVGAAKVDITPPLQPMMNGRSETLRDHLYVRAIVIDNGVTRAALINADQGMLSDDIWADASKRIAAYLQCPVENILISAIHTHSDGGVFARGQFPPQPPQAGDKGPAQIVDAIVESVRQAQSKLQPAAVGYGTGTVNLNVNRDAIHPEKKLWYQGPNLSAPSDKTIYVVTFETPAGDPIAVYYNYAMHPINYYLTGIVSADFPGQASKDIEDYYDGKVTAVFTQSASGDQNPLYLQPLMDMSTVLKGGKAGTTTTESNAFQNPAPAGSDSKPDPKAVEDATAELDRVVKAEGEIISQEVMRVMRHTDHLASDARIQGGQTMIECPGRNRTDQGREGMEGQYVDGPPVHIRIGLLTIGTTAFATVDAEVYNEIWLRLKAESTLRDMLMVTLTDGAANSGYIPNDESFSHNTFQVLGSRLKAGCAEDGIVNGIVNLEGNLSK